MLSPHFSLLLTLFAGLTICAFLPMLSPLLAALIFLPYKFMAETDWSQEWPMLALVTGNVLTGLALAWLLRGKRGWLWSFAGLLAGHVFLCWRLYEMTCFMSDGGMVASIVL